MTLISQVDQYQKNAFTFFLDNKSSGGSRLIQKGGGGGGSVKGWGGEGGLNKGRIEYVRG